MHPNEHLPDEPDASLLDARTPDGPDASPIPILRALLDPDVDFLDLCEDTNLTPQQLAAFLESPQFAPHLAALQRMERLRLRLLRPRYHAQALTTLAQTAEDDDDSRKHARSAATHLARHTAPPRRRRKRRQPTDPTPPDAPTPVEPETPAPTPHDHEERADPPTPHDADDPSSNQQEARRIAPDNHAPQEFTGEAPPPLGSEDGESRNAADGSTDRASRLAGLHAHAP